MNEGLNQEAWLYTFAEPNLVKYAQRIAEEIPEHNVVLREHMPSTIPTLPEKHEPKLSSDSRVQESLEIGSWDTLQDPQESKKRTSVTSQHAETHNHYFDIVGDFRQQIVEVFRSQN